MAAIVDVAPGLWIWRVDHLDWGQRATQPGWRTALRRRPKVA
jgi:hypothetical protein